MLLWRSGPHYCAASLKKALFSVFVRLKVSFYENTSFTNYASGIRLPNCSRLAINWKNGNDGIIFWHYVIFKISWPYFISFVRFSYWSKFHVKIITCSGAMTIPFYNGLTRILKTEIPPSEFCQISWDWRELGLTKLVQMSLIQCYWMLQKVRVTAFTVSELLKRNQRRVKLPPFPLLPPSLWLWESIWTLRRKYKKIIFLFQYQLKNNLIILKQLPTN